ncbi:hypothetical protein RSal33209_2745 [Renibacterium salmoninarum ATCC 33209]|uniref:Uncharacterized protein n=1 Tax=Renibacterium salmoninarum (strain ATCC 33209 / DSM 20767 / JCM 11484 / NBRC 15589 / NCIMB 2235) TaxID=288705 RepID=A9WTE9_RENSM|nr:hypothetical protein [Renibacterium salmoninarum]ABY24470.1 hypothetical protein RSal33209_2745 [Renibacterium salmoninarum ATCC 33209]
MAENLDDQPNDEEAAYRVAWAPLAVCSAGFAAFEVALIWANGQFIWFPVIAVAAAVVMFIILRVLGAKYGAERPWFGGKKTGGIVLRVAGFILFLLAFVLGIIVGTWLRNGLFAEGVPSAIAIVLSWAVVLILALIYYRLVEAIMNLLAAATANRG